MILFTKSINKERAKDENILIQMHFFFTELLSFHIINYLCGGMRAP